MALSINLRRLCESLGVSYAGQHAKLQHPDNDWACIVMIATHDSTGGLQPTCMIHVDSIPMLLMTMQPSRVAFEVREKLERYCR